MGVDYAGMAWSHPLHVGIMSRVGIFTSLISLTFKAKFRPGSEVNQMILGFRVSADSPQTLLSLFREIFIDEVYHFASNTKKPEIIDCGANMGISVLYFKHRFPQARILAIEPNLQAFAYLEKNIAQNGLANVVAIQACLSDQIGKEPFYLPSNGNNYNGSIYPESGKTYLGEVDSIRLSDFLGEKARDFVKIDVEGAERKIMTDLLQSGTLKRSQRYVIEYHSLSGQADIELELIEGFEQQGFKTARLDEADTGQNSKLIRFSQ